MAYDCLDCLFGKTAFNPGVGYIYIHRTNILLAFTSAMAYSLFVEVYPCYPASYVLLDFSSRYHLLNFLFVKSLMLVSDFLF